MIKYFSTIGFFVFFLVGCSIIEPSPVARFEYTEGSATRDGVTYFFTDRSQNGKIYNYDFGDGGSSSNASPNYTFKRNGSYTVRLRVENGSGKSDTFSQTINVSKVPTTGSVVFWSTIGDRGNIEIYINGTLRGTNTKYMTANTAPSCGTDGFTTVTLPEGSYSFTAKTKEAFPITWTGTINVTNGICRNMQLTR